MNFLLPLLSKFNPGLKGWLILALLAGVGTSFWLYGSKQYQAGRQEAITEYQETSQKLLERDMSALRQRLSEAITYKDKMAQKAGELERKLSEVNKRSTGYEKRIEELANRKLECDVIHPEWYRLLQQIYQESPGES